MSSYVASSSTGVTPNLQEVKRLNAKDLNGFLKKNLSDIDNHIDTLTAEEVDGSVFFDLTHEALKAFGVSLKASTKIVKLIRDIQGEQPDVGLATLKNLDEKMDLIRSELGNVYESSARLEIAKINGSHYSSKFEVYDLNGLARLSLPRKQFSNEKPKYESPMYIQASRADKISNYIYNKKMKLKLKESILYIRSLPQNNFIKSLNTLADRAEKSLNDWEAHEKKSTSSENRLYLANTKFLGVMLITSYIMDPKIAIQNDHAPFDEVLEFDIRGRPTSYLDMKNVSIEIGEIKLTTKNLLHGYRQLLIRLAILGFAIEALNSKGDEVADYKCDLVGILYVPKVPSVIKIPSEWESGIKFPKSSNHTIRIVAVGDKP